MASSSEQEVSSAVNYFEDDDFDIILQLLEEDENLENDIDNVSCNVSIYQYVTDTKVLKNFKIPRQQKQRNFLELDYNFVLQLYNQRQWFDLFKADII